MKIKEKCKPQEYVLDEQKGIFFQIVEEKKWDKLIARISIIYLLIFLFFFLWLLFDIWLGKFTIARILGYMDYKALTDFSTLTYIYTFIGGGIGWILNEIRGFLFWHCDHEA